MWEGLSILRIRAFVRLCASSLYINKTGIYHQRRRKHMKQISDERQLLKQIDEAREDLKRFRRRKISHLLHELDTLEQGIKSVGAVGKNTKAAYKKFHVDLNVIKTKIRKLSAKRGAWFF